MYNPELLSYLIDGKSSKRNIKKEAFNPRYKTNAVEDYCKIKYGLKLFLKSIKLIYNEVIRKPDSIDN